MPVGITGRHRCRNEYWPASAHQVPRAKSCLIWGYFPLKENQPFRLMAHMDSMWALGLHSKDGFQ
ncbi:hypothetical protein BG005_011668, partial [Podila minutissima]